MWLYGAMGALHWFVRRPMLALSNPGEHAAQSAARVWMWDFVFYLSFGVVVTSSVTIAGVLLVFSFLIVPAVIGSLFANRISMVLAIAWVSGIVASAAGLGGSYALDLPSGATIVVALAGCAGDRRRVEDAVDRRCCAACDALAARDAS